MYGGGGTLRKERDTLNCPQISVFYIHVSSDHIDLSALLNKDGSCMLIYPHCGP